MCTNPDSVSFDTHITRDAPRSFEKCHCPCVDIAFNIMKEVAEDERIDSVADEMASRADGAAESLNMRG